MLVDDPLVEYKTTRVDNQLSLAVQGAHIDPWPVADYLRVVIGFLLDHAHLWLPEILPDGVDLFGMKTGTDIEATPLIKALCVEAPSGVCDLSLRLTRLRKICTSLN